MGDLVDSPKDNIQHESQPAQLKPFGGSHIKEAIPFNLLDYIELVDWSGHHIDRKKKGHISKQILQAVNND